MPGDQDLIIEAKLAALPKEVRDFIVDPEEDDTSNIFAAAGLMLEQKRLIRNDIKRVYVGDLLVTDFYATIKPKLGLSEDKLNKFIADFIGYRFLPIDDHLKGQASAALIAMGVSPAAYDVKRIVVRKAKPLDLVTEFLHEHPVNVPAHLEQRVREILESRVRGVRKDEDTITRLTRAEKIGGAELPHDEAEKLVEALAAKVASVSIAPDNEPEPVKEALVVEPEPATETVKDAPQITIIPTVAAATRTFVTTMAAPIASSKSGHGVSVEDEHEANIIRATVLPKIVSSALFDMDEEIKNGVNAVFDNTKTPLSVPLEDRYKTVVTSRLKGIRDATETRDLLVREIASGGLGFSVVDADKAMELIEREVKFIVDKKEAAVKNEKAEFVKSSVNATFAKDESRKKGELEELDRMYSSLTGKVSKTPAAAVVAPVPTPPVAPPPKASAPVAPPAPPAPVVKMPLPPIVSPKPSIPVAVAPPPTIQRASTLPPPLPPPPVVPPRPVAPAAPPRPLSPPKPVAAPSPKMQDVRPAMPPTPAARLTGPVQELGVLTLADFRRLAVDPVEACRKITDKLDVLEENSYAQRIAGIKAWQGSDVYKRYLEVINAAFSGGKPIANAIADSQASGRETPTEREVRAIMELNRQLKA